jgi:hypothetical protein
MNEDAEWCFSFYDATPDFRFDFRFVFVGKYKIPALGELGSDGIFFDPRIFHL